MELATAAVPNAESEKTPLLAARKFWSAHNELMGAVVPTIGVPVLALLCSKPF